MDPQSTLIAPANPPAPNAALASLLATPELSVMGQGYAARVTAVQAQRHREVILAHPGEAHKDFLRSAVSTKLLAGPFHHQLFVYCAHSPLALLDVTAAIAQAGGSIYNIFLFPRTDGSLLIECAFVLRGREREELEKIAPALGEIFRLARKPHAGKCEPVRDLEITSDPKDPAVIHLRAADTQGLLYRVVRAFVVLGLRIQWADVRTLAGRAVDSFSITNRQGKAVDWSATLPDLLAEIRQGTD